MSPQQRKDMAEIIANELRARKGENPTRKSSVNGSKFGSDMDASQVSDMYSDVDQTLRQRKVEEIEAKLTQLRKEKGVKQGASSSGKTILAALNQAFERVPFRNALLLFAILFLAVMKVLFSTGIVNASIEKKVEQPVMLNPASQIQVEAVKTYDPGASSAAVGAEPTFGFRNTKKSVNWSTVDKHLLTELDARRVGLEKRREALARRESQLALQEKEVAGRIVELQSLVRKVGDFRKEKDHRYEARLEQLANVYGSMPPNEAAPLIAKLDEHIALALLKRMPGKRMGQILGLMDDTRAIELTRILTDRRNIE